MVVIYTLCIIFSDVIIWLLGIIVPSSGKPAYNKLKCNLINTNVKVNLSWHTTLSHWNLAGYVGNVSVMCPNSLLYDTMMDFTRLFAGLFS